MQVLCAQLRVHYARLTESRDIYKCIMGGPCSLRTSHRVVLGCDGFHLSIHRYSLFTENDSLYSSPGRFYGGSLQILPGLFSSGTANCWAFGPCKPTKMELHPFLLRRTDLNHPMRMCQWCCLLTLPFFLGCDLLAVNLRDGRVLVMVGFFLATMGSNLADFPAAVTFFSHLLLPSSWIDTGAITTML